MMIFRFWHIQFECLTLKEYTSEIGLDLNNQQDVIYSHLAFVLGHHGATYETQMTQLFIISS